MINTVKGYDGLSKHYDKMLAERNSLVDDIAVLRANNEKLERKNEKLRSRLDEFLEHDYDNQELYKENRNLLSEISQHIGNKP
ncbi:hypothetical protein M4L90_03745 [Staphylococcus equorum]|uniref:Uncharacterized protein n=1 Tax=Staphylococcus equorum TaxID=246432 RepID=A0A9X4L780_9STAP|nr:hypothetical protein [Staphylococcus equorum]MDG0819006.1 hypothetical protein [Staphylococcus equorum]MDG0839647.1 hypothetical protein [Staphylococcus equorum]MDG0844627.1 hypothetical protein [Staphylococcus equorum]